MLENSFLNLSPKKAENLVLTKKKLVIALVFLLTIFSIYKVNKVGALSKELFEAKIYIVLATIHDPSKVDDFNKAFTSGAFCGWQIVDADDKKTSSEGFEKTSAGNKILKQEFQFNDVGQTLSICLNKLPDINASVKRQVIGILMLAAVIIFILYSTKFVDDEEEPKKSDDEPQI